MITLTNRIDMRPGVVPLVIHLGQYDSDFSLVFELYSSAGNFTVESGTTAMIRGTKTDGNAYDADATINISSKTVTVAGNEQMTAAKGRNVYELVLKKGTKVLSTANFILDVERAAMDADTIASESVLKELNAIIAGAETATQAATDAASAADRAEDAADSVSSASAQIATNTSDIADLKADLDDVVTSLGYTEPSANILDVTKFEDGYYSNGVWTESSSYKTSNYMSVSGSQSIYLHRFNLNNGQTQDTSRYFSYIYWFDANGNYLNRTDTVSGTTVYSVYNGAKYARVMGTASAINSDLSNNKGYYFGLEDTSIFVPYNEGGLPDYVQIIDDINEEITNIESSIGKTTVSLASNAYTIKTPKAQFLFKKDTVPAENLDAWRLYDGYLIAGNNGLFNMWHNSDAEGAIKIAGETDYVSGFHGSEVSTSIKVFIDGVDCTGLASISEKEFKTLSFYVESDVYHCYQDEEADTVAFKRSKIVEFSGDKVTISNSYIAQSDFVVTSARTALFQCYKLDGTTPVFTDFSVNSDFKNYAVADVGTTKPSNSDKMTEAILNTIYANIRFKSLLTSGQAYMGSVVNFASQKRIKFYFDTIASNTNITTNEQIKSQFEFEII